MGKTFLNLAAAACLLVNPPIADAQQNLDIVQIMGQFVQANYAAYKCTKPDRQTLTHFLHNFRIVSIRAGEELRKRNPGASEQQIYESLERGREAVEKQLDAVLDSNGCDDPRIRELLKLFRMQADLKF